MVMPSCYSGGWVISFNSNKNFDIKPTFNQSLFTAVGHGNESISWSVSQTVGRQTGGSVLATCLLNSITTATDARKGFYGVEGTHSNEGSYPETTGYIKKKLVRIKDDDKGQNISPSMAALTQQVVYECQARCGSLWDKHQFSFAIQDEIWDQA
jgi:hypothetical protein